MTRTLGDPPSPRFKLAVRFRRPSTLEPIEIVLGDDDGDLDTTEGR